MVAAQAPSGESRVRLGTPASGRSRRTRQSASRTAARYVVTKPGSDDMQTASSRCAYTRSQLTGVNARGPPGSASGASATFP
ncbi:hypothetical protein Asi03nite_27100 [Actinoplanes siamensis]|uniref:Uncharacterized protein n=1 Tax=Actinoplanes siamensis TaxID=1223317 RepID=A0A919N6B4_9ACTN|nr:hypothetical protein Asi03nite_27100 [Actinoplanes siamensis]